MLLDDIRIVMQPVDGRSRLWITEPKWFEECGYGSIFVAQLGGAKTTDPLECDARAAVFTVCILEKAGRSTVLTVIVEHRSTEENEWSVAGSFCTSNRGLIRHRIDGLLKMARFRFVVSAPQGGLVRIAPYEPEWEED